MTFLDLQDAVLDRVNLSSAEARARVSRNLNLRYREVQSTLQLDKTRRGSVDITTASGSPTVTVSGVAKLLGLYDPNVLHRELDEKVLSEIEARTAHNALLSTPTIFAIDEHLNDVVILRFYPIPNAALALEADCLLAGTDMVDDDDEPTIPVDFHDVLLRGALADEYDKMEKFKEAAKQEQKFEKRLSDLRFFIAKSKLQRQVQHVASSAATRVWPFSNLA